MKLWCAVVCIVMLWMVPAQAQDYSEGDLTKIIWDFQDEIHQMTLVDLTADRTFNMHMWGVDDVTKDEIAVLYKYAANGFPLGRNEKIADWKIHFHVLADISERSPIYFGGPLRIKQREVRKSENFLANTSKEKWDHTSPEDRETLFNMLLLQVQSEKKLLVEKLERDKPEGYVSEENWWSFVDHSLELKLVLGDMTPEEEKPEKTRFQLSDKGWELFFFIAESISYWTKEFYGTPLLGQEILLK